MKRFVLILVCLFLIIMPISLSAQSYATIDDDLNLYCADLPDGNNMLTTVYNNNGLYTVNPVDPKEQISKIVKLRKKLQQRVNTLSKIKKSYSPSQDIKKLKSTLKFVASEVVDMTSMDESFDQTKPNKIHKKIGFMISQLRRRLDELQEALEMIDRCLKNEDLIPPPQALGAEVIVFPFNHPDHKATYWMRGLGVTAILHKKRYSGVVCVSASKTHSNIRAFPRETAIAVFRNPCLLFWQKSFRNYPFCNYGSKDTAVGWFSSTEPGFGSPLDEDDYKELQRRLDFYSPIRVRAPTKKNPCRNK